MTATAAQMPATAPRSTAATKPQYTVRDLLMDKQREILAALPKHITPAYFMRVVLTAVQKTPKLAECTPVSFLGAALQCAQLGLVPDGFLGQAYLIPFENTKKRVFEVQFQCGYRGLITLARRSGEIATIGAEAVYEKDSFRQVRGLNPTVEHTPFPDIDADPGPLVQVYSWYRLKDGGYDLNVMNRRQVHAIRARSQAYRSGVKFGKHDSPWFTDEAWMWKKTSLKQLLKLAPLSVEIQRVAGLDDAAEAGLPQDLAMLADPTAEPTVLLEGDSLEEDTTRGEDTMEMPPGVSDPPAPTPAPPPAERRTCIDRIGDVSQVRDGWAASTGSGLRIWTRDPALGAALVAAKGQLRHLTAEPADSQGRRKLLTLTEE